MINRKELLLQENLESEVVLDIEKKLPKTNFLKENLLVHLSRNNQELFIIFTLTIFRVKTRTSNI